MNTVATYTLKGLRKLYSKSPFSNHLINLQCISEPNAAAEIIYEVLADDKPRMIARFGAIELTCLSNYLGIKHHQNKILGYIKGDVPKWWWEPKIVVQMQQNTGFFPAKVEYIEKFCDLMIRDIPLVDILGSWLTEERLFEKELSAAQKIGLIFFDPFWAKNPWTKALEGKKILVVHPFAETIQQQYKKRKLLFENNLLPKFELETIKAVQSIAGTKTPFVDWFEAFEYMKNEIDKTDYDICLIGAGAYGFPLAAHVKRMGKKGFHLGGSLQLLFGIRGNRWEENYHPVYNYPKLFNEHWVRPNEQEKPLNAQIVEGACYW